MTATCADIYAINEFGYNTTHLLRTKIVNKDAQTDTTRFKWQSEVLKSLNGDTLHTGTILIGIDPSDKQQSHYQRVCLGETLGTAGEWCSPHEY